MRDSNYFSKLRTFLLSGSGRRRRRPVCASVRMARTRRASPFNLEPLEPRVLLSADLAGAVQAMQVVEPVVPQQAAVSFLETNQGSETNNAVATTPTETAKLDAAYGNLPYSFEANQGQTDSEVSYLARGDGYSLFLTGDGAVLSLQQEDGSAPAVLTMDILGANPDAVISGEQLLPGVANYFVGNDSSQWQTNIPTFEQVRYDEIYAGIDLLYYGKQGQLEYDFVVEPGVDPGVIQFSLKGADNLQLDEQGNLNVDIGDETVQLLKPIAYQTIDGSRQDISGSFVLDENGQVGFQVGAYDSSQPLIIDPILKYSTYIGGSATDQSYGLAVDGAGNAYITGVTDSPSFAGRPTGGGDAFVTKLNETGTAVLYSTYLTGALRPDQSFTIAAPFDGYIAVDGSGNAYVTGYTASTNFPTTEGAFQRTYGGGNVTR